jgi:RsiW-degrading membrane proteinase PrsW (M82 family)
MPGWQLPVPGSNATARGKQRARRGDDSLRRRFHRGVLDLDWSQLRSGSAGAIVGAALLWLIYFDLKDSLQKEPRLLMLAAFALGGVAACLGLLIYAAAVRLGLPVDPGSTRSEIVLYCLLGVGPVEEGCKFLVARTIIFRWRAFDERIDGLVYSAALAIGFATLENFYFLIDQPYLDVGEQLTRAAVSPLTHSLFAAIWGFGVSRAFFGVRSRRSRLLWQLFPLLLAMFLHGLYDALLLAGDATIPASATILVIWVFVIRNARRVLRARAS